MQYKGIFGIYHHSMPDFDAEIWDDGDVILESHDSRIDTTIEDLRELITAIDDYLAARKMYLEAGGDTSI